MLFWINADVVDDDLTRLTDLCRVVDGRSAAIIVELRGITEECPAHEELDDLIGLGFVACQRYLTQITATLRLEKRRALSVGPTATTGQFISEIINAADNAWKHEGEWDLVVEFGPQDESGLHPVVGRSWTAESKVGATTIGFLTQSVPFAGWDYKFVNALHLLDPDLRFSAVVELLVEWRDTMIKMGEPAP